MDLRSLQPFNLPPEPAAKAPRLDTALPKSGQLNPLEPGEQDSPELKKAFTDFVGQTLFGSMLASMRKTVGKPAYVHGGRTEEVFQKQLDQMIVEDLTDASAESLAEPMFELFNLQRR
jgi:hypothetical protein